jgi:hypothetical protein
LERPSRHGFRNFREENAAFPGKDELEELSTQLIDGNDVDTHVILSIYGVIIKLQRPDHVGDAYCCRRNGEIMHTIQ